MLDIKEKFRRCRRDLGDTMINPYYVLRDELLDILLVHTNNLLDQLNNSPSSLLQVIEIIVCIYYQQGNVFIF